MHLHVSPLNITNIKTNIGQVMSYQLPVGQVRSTHAILGEVMFGVV